MAYEEMSVAVFRSLYVFCLFGAVTWAAGGLVGFCCFRERILPLLVICLPGFCVLLGLLVVQNIDYGYLQDDRKPRWQVLMSQADFKRSFPAVESVTSWRENGWKSRIDLSLSAPVPAAERMEMSRSLVAAYLKIQPDPWEEVRLLWRQPGSERMEESLTLPAWWPSITGAVRNSERYPGRRIAMVAVSILAAEALLIAWLSRKFLFAAAKNRQERGLIGGTVVWLAYSIGMLLLMGMSNSGFYAGLNGFLWGGASRRIPVGAGRNDPTAAAGDFLVVRRMSDVVFRRYFLFTSGSDWLAEFGRINRFEPGRAEKNGARL